MIDPDPIRERFSELSPHLNERERRLLAATEANAAGYGGIAAVARATGLAASTIGRGLKDLAGDTALTPGRVRRVGGGRKPLAATDPGLLTELMAPGVRRGRRTWRSDVAAALDVQSRGAKGPSRDIQPPPAPGLHRPSRQQAWR